VAQVHDELYLLAPILLPETNGLWLSCAGCEEGARIATATAPSLA